MKKQDHTHHVRYYPPHHFIFYPVLLILLVLSTRQALSDSISAFTWWMITAGLLLIGWLSFMTRQHYALMLQDRVVRLELRFRYFAITGQRLEPFEDQLGFARIAALRFASDEELPDLVDKAIRGNIEPGVIKKEIANWQADHMRV